MIKAEPTTDVKVTDEVQAEREELLKFFHPKLTDVLSEMFSKWTFSRDGQTLSSSEVFSSIGFLPVILFMAQSFYEDNFRDSPLPRGMIDKADFDVDSSIFGLESKLDMSLAKPEQAALFTIVTSYVCFEMFGLRPTHIDLDGLFEWANDRDAQALGLPHLDKTTGASA